MSDTLEQLHAAAFLALFTSEITVYDGAVPNGILPQYVVVHSMISWPGDGAANALNAQAVTVRCEFNVHCVGATAAAARAVQAQARQAVLNQRLVVAGRQSGLIDMVEALAPSRDQTTGTTVFDAVVNFEVITTP